MNLTLEKLKNLWEHKKSVFSSKQDLSDRFEEITTITDNFLELDISSYELKITEFTCDGKDILTDNSKTCYFNMLDKTDKDDEKTHIKNCWKLIAGYQNENPNDDFRIISNNSKEPDYHGKLSSHGNMSVRVNGNFASNNYFFNIAKFLQEAKEKKTFDKLIGSSKIVLTYLGSKDLGGVRVKKDDAFIASKELLNKKFPPKFLWMWANKEEVLHPFSLSAFQNFLDTEYGKKILKDSKPTWTPEFVTNDEFDNFTKNWNKISEKIVENILGEDKEKHTAENLKELSKLISIISIEDADLKNIEEILQIGNKAVILWGPPGTGKTYESMQVVKKILALNVNLDDLEFERKYLFSKHEMAIDSKHGYYEIIQFHPNYTYEDFIGGIQPVLDKKGGGGLTYELKAGIFKRFCDTAKTNKEKQYIFIIDEINRAELSAVFGELLFALEYRDKSINLPHFGEFSIPKNVYLIGTMNNVDKSLVTFDLALRRRFGFFKLMPKLDTLATMQELDFLEFQNRQKFIERSKELNNHIKELRLGDDYQIGQAYFKKIIDFVNKNEKDTISSFALEKLWEYHLYPLLEEYLGMSIEDESIEKELKNLKEIFIKDLGTS